VKGIRGSAGALALAAAWAVAAPAPAADEGVVDEVLAILRDRGLVDEAQYGELVARNERYEEQHQGLLGRLEWSGDFRGRIENFWFDDDALDSDRDNRHRLRYRLRIGATAEINDYVEAGFRLASGERISFDEGDNRSTNRTLGRDSDFGLDTVFIDQAWVRLMAPGAWVGESSSLDGWFGKFENPFRWKSGKDYMLWDGDLSPEGAALVYTTKPAENLTLGLNSGYFIADENSTSADPHLLGIQGVAELAATDLVDVGARVSWYAWHSLDGAFFARSAATGNLSDGLAGEAPSASNDGFDVGELAAYVRVKHLEDWPLLVYAHYARNFDAESSNLFPEAGSEDTGWGLGVEVGDKKKYVMLGVGYYHLEANFWPSQFNDSDLFDGVTNREGWTLYGARQILPNTELNVTLFVSDDIRSSLPGFATSAANAERVRLQTDLVVKF
jgi:hypothetical protein